PDNSRTHGFHYAKRLVNIACPHGASQPVRRVVGDADGVGLILKRDYASHRTKNFFASDTRAVVHVVEDGWLDVITLGEGVRAAAASRGLGLLFAKLQVRTHPVVLFLADQRPHLGLALEWWPKLDALGFLGHRVHKFRIDLLFHQNATARGTHFTLIDEHP